MYFEGLGDLEFETTRNLLDQIPYNHNDGICQVFWPRPLSCWPGGEECGARGDKERNQKAQGEGAAVDFILFAYLGASSRSSYDSGSLMLFLCSLPKGFQTGFAFLMLKKQNPSSFTKMGLQRFIKNLMFSFALSFLRKEILDPGRFFAVFLQPYIAPVPKSICLKKSIVIKQQFMRQSNANILKTTRNFKRVGLLKASPIFCGLEGSLGQEVKPKEAKETKDTKVSLGGGRRDGSGFYFFCSHIPC